jgi:hypothetical protein
MDVTVSSRTLTGRADELIDQCAQLVGTIVLDRAQ